MTKIRLSATTRQLVATVAIGLITTCFLISAHSQVGQDNLTSRVALKTDSSDKDTKGDYLLTIRFGNELRQSIMIKSDTPFQVRSRISDTDWLLSGTGHAAKEDKATDKTTNKVGRMVISLKLGKEVHRPNAQGDDQVYSSSLNISQGLSIDGKSQPLSGPSSHSSSFDLHDLSVAVENSAAPDTDTRVIPSAISSH